MKAARLMNIFIMVFVNLLGFCLFLGLLPACAENFGSSPIIVDFALGRGQALYAYRR